MMDKAAFVVIGDLDGIDTSGLLGELDEALAPTSLRIARTESIHTGPHNVTLRQQARAELIREHLEKAVSDYVGRHGGRVLELDGVRRRPHIVPIPFPEELLQAVMASMVAAIHNDWGEMVDTDEQRGFLENLEGSYRPETIVHSLMAQILPRMVESLLKGESLY